MVGEGGGGRGERDGERGRVIGRERGEGDGGERGGREREGGEREKTEGESKGEGGRERKKEGGGERECRMMYASTGIYVHLKFPS